MYRQGDVLIQKVHSIPKTAVQQRDCVLARGEATGHAHQIKDGAYLLIDTDGAKYIDVIDHEVMVLHEEHEPIILQGPAVYRITQQREYHPAEIRTVRD